MPLSSRPENKKSAIRGKSANDTLVTLINCVSQKKTLILNVDIISRKEPRVNVSFSWDLSFAAAKQRRGFSKRPSIWFKISCAVCNLCDKRSLPTDKVHDTIGSMNNFSGVWITYFRHYTSNLGEVFQNIGRGQQFVNKLIGIENGVASDVIPYALQVITRRFCPFYCH